MSMLVFQAGRAATFAWRAPRCPDEATTPSVSIDTAGGPLSGSLTRIRGNASVTAISQDRRTLTTSGIADIEGHAGDDGAAFLRTVEGGIFPVRVVSIDDSAETVTLGAALPRGVDVAGSTLIWATWVFPLLAPQMVAERNVAWEVAWKETTGGDGRLITQTSTGTLDIVERPFDTGLSHHVLVELYPFVVADVHRDAQDLTPQIAATRRELVQRLDAALVDRGLDAHDVDGSRFLDAHAAMAAAMACEFTKADEKVQGLLSRSTRLYQTALEALWVDVNRDGAVDSGEVGRQRLRRSLVGGSASGTRTATFSKGMNW